MRNNDQTAEEYRDWIIEQFHKCGHDELIALICPYGEDSMVKDMFDIMDGKKIYDDGSIEP